MLLAHSKQIHEFADIVTIISSLITIFHSVRSILNLSIFLFTIEATAILLSTHRSYLPLISNLGTSNNNKINLMLTQTKWNFYLQPVL